jgi:hypothetical protein
LAKSTVKQALKASAPTIIARVLTASRPVAAASAIPAIPVTSTAKISGTTVMRRPFSQSPPIDSMSSMARLTPGPP